MAQLKKDGTEKIIVKNKSVGDESEVYNIKPEDVKKIRDWMIQHKKWSHILALGLATNLMLRAGDTLSFRWEHFFNPETGERRERYKSIKEQKTNKKSSKLINEACWMEIEFYISKTSCHPEENNYCADVFKQLSGNFRGRTLSESSFLKVIKKAAKEVGVTYNVGTHSCRKTAGNTLVKRHSKDEIGMETVSSLLNHSNIETTRAYTGVTREHMDEYLSDLGSAWMSYAIDGEACNPVTHETTILFDVATARNFSKLIYLCGKFEVEVKSGISNSQTIKDMQSVIDCILNNITNKNNCNVASFLDELGQCKDDNSVIETIYKIGSILQLK